MKFYCLRAEMLWVPERGFSLIGDIVEESTGETYGNFLDQEIFKPLGMTTATVGLDAFEENLMSPLLIDWFEGTGDLPQITQHTTQWPLRPVLMQVS